MIVIDLHQTIEFEMRIWRFHFDHDECNIQYIVYQYEKINDDTREEEDQLVIEDL